MRPEAPSNPSDTRDLHDLVRRTGRALRVHWCVMGLAVVIVAALATLLSAALIDLLVALPVALRLIACIAFWGVTIGLLGLCVLRPQCRSLSSHTVAHRVERVVPNMHNRLITALDLQSRGEQDVHPDFFARLVNDTRGMLRGFDTNLLAPRRLRRCAIGAVMASVLVFMLISVLLMDRMPTALARIWWPTAMIPPATSVRYHGPGDMRVLQGEPCTLVATITRGQVEALRVRLRPEGGNWSEYAMTPHGDAAFAFHIPQVDASYEFQIVGGGTWTVPHRISALRRPVIEAVETRVYLPSYMGIPEPRDVPEDGTPIRTPIGSEVEVSVSVQGEVRDGTIELFAVHRETKRETWEDVTVWVDDDVPPDAVRASAPWRWSTQRVRSGARAHTHDDRGTTYGFRTRHNGLTVEPGQMFFLDIFMEEDDEPYWVQVSLLVNGTMKHFIWWSPRRLDARTIERLHLTPNVDMVGELPEPGDWAALEIEVATLIDESSDKPLVITGTDIDVHGGRSHFDRIGSVSRGTHEREEVTRIAAGSIAMSLDPTMGRWRGRIPADANVGYAFRFRNELDHVNTPTQPRDIIVTEDHAPTIVIAHPTRDVMLAESVVVPVIVRAFDDWGLQDVGLQFGTNAEAFDEPQWVESYDEVVTSRHVVTGIDPHYFAMTPGDVLYYRAVARYRRGQLAVS